MSTKELKNIAKERKLQNYHNLSKEDLSRMLKIPIFLTKRYYQNIAKDRNLKNYHNLNKADLIQLLNMKPEIPISKKPIPKPIPKPEKPISEKPIPAPRRKPEKPIPAPRRKPIPKPEKPITEKPIPAPRQKPISEKPIPAPRQNPPTIQKAIDTMLGWVDWFRKSGKKITQPISSALNTLRKKKYPL